MADVRLLLKSERVARRIQHRYASYSTTGTLLCTACRLQLKTESLWDGHLRSAGHLARANKLQEIANDEPPTAEPATKGDANKKRKASGDDIEGTIRKRNRPIHSISEGFFDRDSQFLPAVQVPIEMQIPSRPATPQKTPDEFLKRLGVPQAAVDEGEWAAFQADIAAEEIPLADPDVVISAPAMTAEDVRKKSAEEEYVHLKEKHEAETEGDKEDAARKLEEEFEQMEALEARVRHLREKREELRKKESLVGNHKKYVPEISAVVTAEDEKDVDDDDDDDDDWDGFRMKG